MDPIVQVALISALVTIVGMLAEGWRRQHKVLTETRDNSRETREQTKNSHSTNLRDDIDDLHDSVRLTLTSLADLRVDMRLEREERLDVARRLEAHRVEVAHRLELLTLATARNLQQSQPPAS